MLADIRNVHNDQHKQHHNEDDGGKRVDLRAHLAAGHGEDGDGQCLRTGAGGEIADDEIVNGIGDADEEAGKHTRHDLGQNHLEKRLNIVAAEIQRRIVNIAVELAKLRQHIQNDIGHAEGNVRQDKRYIPKLHLHGDKEQHQRNARDDFRVDDRQIGDIEHQGAYDFFHVVNADGSERAEHGGKRGGNQSNDYGVEQGAQNGFVMKELYIPIQRKSRPYRAAFGLIEGVCNQNADGGIQKQEYQKEIEI